MSQTASTPGPRWQQECHRLATAPRFAALVISVIMLNALALGIGTFASVEQNAGHLLKGLDHLFLVLFTLELTVRLAAVGFRPGRFLHRGWNVFDLLVVGASFVPGLSANATALRLIRLLRVARLLSVLPDVRVLLDGLRRAARPSAGIMLLTLLIMYVYGIVGWSLFGAADPERWGDIGVALLSLFQLLTHHDWPSILTPIRGSSPFAVPFVVSFILVTAFLVVQFLVAVVITSLEEARADLHDSVPPLQGGAARAAGRAELALAVAEMRAALTRLEHRRRGAEAAAPTTTAHPHG